MKRPDQFPKKTSKTKSDVPNFVKLLTNTVSNPHDIHLFMDQEFSSQKIHEYLEEKGKQNFFLSLLNPLKVLE